MSDPITDIVSLLTPQEFAMFAMGQVQQLNGVPKRVHAHLNTCKTKYGSLDRYIKHLFICGKEQFSKRTVEGKEVLMEEFDPCLSAEDLFTNHTKTIFEKILSDHENSDF